MSFLYSCHPSRPSRFLNPLVFRLSHIIFLILVVLVSFVCHSLRSHFLFLPFLSYSHALRRYPVVFVVLISFPFFSFYLFFVISVSFFSFPHLSHFYHSSCLSGAFHVTRFSCHSCPFPPTCFCHSRIVLIVFMFILSFSSFLSPSPYSYSSLSYHSRHSCVIVFVYVLCS